MNSTTGNNASAVLGTAPFKTITAAVQYASAVAATGGANIYVASGVYNTASGEVFPIRLTDGINLIGSGIAEVEGAGNFAVGSGERMGSNISTTFAASSPSATNRINVSITGLAASSVGNAPTFISTVNTNLAFTGNTLTYPVNAGNYPMWIMASSVAAVSNNTISAWVALDTADAGTKVIARGNHFDGGFTICTSDFTAAASQLDLGTAASPGNNTILKTGGGTAGVNNWGGRLTMA